MSGAAGYVLGARAGRQRYDQIASGTRRFMGNPKVQAAKQQAQDTIVEQASAAGSVVADKAKETAAAAAEKVRRNDDSGADSAAPAGQPTHRTTAP